MRTIAIYLVGCLALAACAESEPVDETEPTPVPSEALPADVARPAELRGDTGAAGVRGGTDAGSGQLAEGQWFAKTERGVPMAMFGPPQSEALFSIRCEESELVVARGVTTEDDTVTMDLTAGGETRTIVATARQDPLPRVTGSLLENDPFADMLASVAQPITVRVGDGPSLRIPAHEHLRQVAANCGD